jgi:DNA-binding FadR family transcriptional regulator
VAGLGQPGGQALTRDSMAEPSLRIHQAVARKIGISILSGEMQPGAGFDREIEHSAVLGVSRTAYREALKLLAAKGLLESRPKIGTHVRPRSEWNLLDTDVLSWMFAGKPDPDFVRDLFELREVIEPAAAEMAAARRNDVQLETMRSALRVMQQETLITESGRDADQRFHRALLEASCNSALISLASSIGTAVGLTTKFKEDRSREPRDPLPEHEAVYEAVARSDTAGARTAMIQLLRLALQDMQLVI